MFVENPKHQKINKQKIIRASKCIHKTWGYKINILKINYVSILAVSNQKIKLREQLH